MDLENLVERRDVVKPLHFEMNSNVRLAGMLSTTLPRFLKLLELTKTFKTQPKTNLPPSEGCNVEDMLRNYLLILLIC